MKSVGALTRLAGTTWGGSYISLRRIYRAIVIPQITYACSAWAAPYRQRTRDWIGFKQVQAKGARLITGAYKATSFAALNIEAFLQPIEYIIEETALLLALRIRTSPIYKELYIKIWRPDSQDLKSPKSLLYHWLQRLKNEYGYNKLIESFILYLIVLD